MYPVDLPPVDDTDLTLASEQYFAFLESRHYKTEEFPSSTATRVWAAPFCVHTCVMTIKLSLM